MVKYKSFPLLLHLLLTPTTTLTLVFWRKLLLCLWAAEHEIYRTCIDCECEIPSRESKKTPPLLSLFYTLFFIFLSSSPSFPLRRCALASARTRHFSLLSLYLTACQIYVVPVCRSTSPSPSLSFSFSSLLTSPMWPFVI